LVCQTKQWALLKSRALAVYGKLFFLRDSQYGIVNIFC